MTGTSTPSPNHRSRARAARRFPALAAVALVAVSLAFVAAPARAELVLGEQGRLFQVRQGTLGDAVPGASPLERDHSVLLFEQVAPDEAPILTVIPGTEGPELDGAPFLAYETSASTLFVAWESRIHGIFSQLNMIWYRDGVWSQVVELSGNPFNFKSPPQFAITRDYVNHPAAGHLQETRRQRTVIHLVWWEERTDGGEVLYSPVVLVDGEYLGENRVYSLHTFTAPETTTGSSGWSGEVAKRPTIQESDSGDSVITAFVGPDDRIYTVELTLVDDDLVSLAGAIGAHIIDIGHRFRPGQLDAFAGSVGAHIIDIGLNFNPRMRRSIANEVMTLILDNGDEYDPALNDLDQLAGSVGAHIIDIGLSLQRSDRPRGPDRQLLEIRAPAAPDEAVPAAVGDRPAHLIETAAVASFDALQSDRVPSGFYLSPDGELALLAWDEEGKIRYREIVDGEWSEGHTLHLSGELGSAEAHRILKEHIEQRR